VGVARTDGLNSFDAVRAQTGALVPIGEYTYASKPDHRDGTRIKSQWTIEIIDEYACFQLGVDRSWKRDDVCAWGLHLVDGRAAYLGQTALDPGPQADSWVAFFRLSDTCHGYPSDPKRSIKEVPPEAVRGDWLAMQYVRPAAVRKLGRTVKCRL
jgi:hypothetical protein